MQDVHEACFILLEHPEEFLTSRVEQFRLRAPENTLKLVKHTRSFALEFSFA